MHIKKLIYDLIRDITRIALFSKEACRSKTVDYVCLFYGLQIGTLF
jgi:hypothetical protein